MKDIHQNNFSINESFIPKRSQLEKCTNKINEAHGVPNEYYIQSECFELEGEHLFNKGWFAVGFGEDRYGKGLDVCFQRLHVSGWAGFWGVALIYLIHLKLTMAFGFVLLSKDVLD